MGLWHARLLTWRRSLWFKHISESRHPRFEPDIDNTPHEISCLLLAWLPIPMCQICPCHNVEEVNLVRTYQRKPPSKIRTRYRQRYTQNLMFTISVITITNLLSMSMSQRGRGQSGSNVSAKAAVQDSNQIDNVPHLMFSDYHYD